ncbi:hypothetical protein AURDEDRAFT_117065 [Auricularia subglabra TFB-10046 SS5]|uniref:DUF6533 domain-containing protein n=1 Tax=Auricularia subglabra (strain TFB-10046 / SS5) TaxID=717982 RepID=J0WUR8_AURST|nr:hypothetical protein AURDEDRAFT_117065 [Auricularia subglabra TFB-10046 SS5]
MSSSLDVDAQLQILQNARAASYLLLAFFVWGVYDHASSLDEEIAWIESTRLRRSKIVYLTNRYTFLASFSVRVATVFIREPDFDSVCRPATAFLLGSNILLHTITNVSLSLRLHALYEEERFIKLSLVTAIVLYVALSIIVVPLTWKNGILPWPKLAPGLPTGCLLVPPHKFWTAFILDFIFEAAVFGLTARRILQWKRGFARDTDTPLMTHMLNAGLGYFAAIGCTLIFATVVSFTRWNAVFGGTGFTVAVTSVASSRMLLALRMKVENPPQVDLASIELVTTRFFASPPPPSPRGSYIISPPRTSLSPTPPRVVSPTPFRSFSSARARALRPSPLRTMSPPLDAAYARVALASPSSASPVYRIADSPSSSTPSPGSSGASPSPRGVSFASQALVASSSKARLSP